MSQMSLEDAMTETRAICELVTGDPLKAEHRQAVVDAIRLVAERDGVVDVNAVRPHIPSWVDPKVIAATYNGLRTRKVLVPTGEIVVNTDTKGRNVGKLQRIYRWVGDVA